MKRWWERLEDWFWRRRHVRKWRRSLVRLPLEGETQIIEVHPQLEGLYAELLLGDLRRDND